MLDMATLDPREAHIALRDVLSDGASTDERIALMDELGWRVREAPSAALLDALATAELFLAQATDLGAPKVGALLAPR